MTEYNIFIVDDHPLFRDALRQALEGSLENLHITEAGSLNELTSHLDKRTHPVDLVLLDLSMPGVKGFSGLLFLRAQYQEIPVIIVSATEEPKVIRRSFEFGASGYIPKSVAVEEIRNGVKMVLNGDVYTPPDISLEEDPDDDISELVARVATLTPQQVRVLMMLGEGLLNKQIAYELSVSEATVKAHVSAILQKLNVDSRTQAVIAVNKIDSVDWQNSDV
ncbi:MAG: response regulator transcription factor [Pseudomonadota bacterium]